tara:strand:- start:116 stop:376 length:261 start_codon:yes stop_codon:yes gene_type:complete
MDINKLTNIVKDKLIKNIEINQIKIDDRTFLHKKHSSHQKGKFHIRITLKSDELNNMSKIQSNRTIYKILSYEIENYIHSIEIDLL